MNRKKSDKWDEKEKDDARSFNASGTYYEGSYPYLPKKVTIVFVGMAILMFAIVVNGWGNGERIELEWIQKIEAMSCFELHEFIENNIDDFGTTREAAWAERSLPKFLDECSSYGS